MTESDVQHQILAYLSSEQAAGRVSWYCRMNSGAVQHAGRFVQFYDLHVPGRPACSAGMSDILVMLPGGRLAALEVKSKAGRATATQSAFLAAVATGGGIGAVVRSWEDAKTALFGTESA